VQYGKLEAVRWLAFIGLSDCFELWFD